MKHTIKFKIQIAIAVIIATVSLIQAWFSTSQLQQETHNAIESQMASSADSTSRYISNWLDTRGEMLLANESLIRTGDNIDRELLLTKRTGKFLSVYAGFSDGSIAYGDKTEDWPADYDPRTRPWYQDGSSASGLIITDPYQDFDGSLVVSLSKAFNGAKQGVLAADLTVTHVIDQVLSLNLNHQGFAFLVDGNNQIVAYRDEKLSRQPLTNLDDELTQSAVSAFRQSNQMNEFFFDNENKEKLIYLTNIPGTNWTLGVVEDKELAFESVAEQLWFTVFSSVILYVIISIIAGFTINRLLLPLSQLTQAVKQLAQGSGDLTHRIEIQRQDEIGELANYMNQFLAELQSMIKGVVDRTHSITAQAQDSSQISQASSQQVENQQGEVNQIATAIHEMSATAAEVASHAELTAGAAQHSTQACQDGQEVIQKNLSSIHDLSSQVQEAAGVIEQLENNAQEINQILATIQGIAEQTNLLALNAAIEAARAGEQGRGFAVVADEVRVLSKRTHDSTEEIRSMIDTLQNNSRQAVDTMQASTELTTNSVEFAQAASDSLSQITSSITEISDMATQIASAAEEQRAVSEDISRNTQSVKELSDQLAEQAAQGSQSAHNMSEATADMLQDVSRFKI
ncbi:methyl-accepting chemotaxis protein [Vibrio sp. Of7-15]|uniref:methyl-accepting chemotaxis protein n=1 Tax=Vibrio sp. Of7-15 TaxID=2724879 RepID=UPI001EF3C348|nr:methyl-accepting chemotaxis protein [Vibrio sp. Of7-15]MCG7499007.1 methyl-accepting chemotaxis protein [Vibrio sp. Of7-15]